MNVKSIGPLNVNCMKKDHSQVTAAYFEMTQHYIAIIVPYIDVTSLHVYTDLITLNIDVTE